MDLPGKYKVISASLTIRKEPRITAFNKTGMLMLGDERNVYEFVTTTKGETWGRVSEFDDAGKAHWACIRNLNRTFMELVEKATPIVTIPTDKIELIVNGVTVYKNF